MNARVLGIACLLVVMAMGCHRSHREPRAATTVSLSAGASRVNAPTGNAHANYGSADYWLVAPRARLEYEGRVVVGGGLNATMAHFGRLSVSEDYQLYGFSRPSMNALSFSPFIRLDMTVVDLEFGLSFTGVLNDSIPFRNPVSVWPYFRMQIVPRSIHGFQIALLSTDNYMTDPNALSIGYVGRGEHIRVVTGFGVGVRMTPDLAADQDSDDLIYVGGLRSPYGHLYAFFDIAVPLHPKVALVARIAGGAQRPIGTIGLRMAPVIEARDEPIGTGAVQLHRVEPRREVLEGW